MFMRCPNVGRLAGVSQRATPSHGAFAAVSVRSYRSQREIIRRRKKLRPINKPEYDGPRIEPPAKTNPDIDISWYPKAENKKSLRKHLAASPCFKDNDNPNYRIVAGTVVERTAVCMPELFEWEKEWEKYEEERHEAKTLEVPEMLKPGALARREGTLKTEEEEAEEAFLDGFVPAPRYTEDDVSGNTRTINRRLQESLYLIVKKDRAEHAWQFPQGGWEEGETIRQTAEREYHEECGHGMNLYFLGNAPIGFHQYEAAPEGSKYQGTKLFLHHAVLTGEYQKQGEITLNKEEGLVDYAWVTKKELPQYLSEDLMELVKDMLFDMDSPTAMDLLAEGKLKPEEMLAQ